MKPVCAICHQRRAERYCPALGEKICAIDCGTGREITIDCPSDCSHLLAARRWEQAHPQSIAEKEIPFVDVRINPDHLLRERQDVLSALVYAVLGCASDRRSLVDEDVFVALHAQAETRRTLLSGIYYEKPPANPAALVLYEALTHFFEEQNKRAAQDPRFRRLSDTEAFHLLILLLRFGRGHSNGRPRTRGFLDFLRTQFPAQQSVAPEEPRIVMP